MAHTFVSQIKLILQAVTSLDDAVSMNGQYNDSNGEDPRPDV